MRFLIKVARSAENYTSIVDFSECIDNSLKEKDHAARFVLDVSTKRRRGVSKKSEKRKKTLETTKMKRKNKIEKPSSKPWGLTQKS